MSGFFELVRFHRLASPVEATTLTVCLAMTLWAFARHAGWPAALVLAGGGFGAFLQTGHVTIPLAIAGVGLYLTFWPGRAEQERSGFPREAGLVVVGFLAYEWSRWWIAGGLEAASANAARVISVERRLGVFFEPRVQSALARADVGGLWNFAYSQGFLAIVVGLLVGLYFTDRGRYRLYRNALGLSTVPAVLLIAAFPVAPPRLMTGLGIEDTVALAGHEHAYVNELAAVPSLHVGWLALSGYVLSLPLSGWRRWAVMTGPGVVMGTTVVATGNHYWLDGVVGSVISVAPAMALRRGWFRTAPVAVLAPPTAVRLAATRSRYSLAGLGGLFLYLGLAEVVQPGFTDFWGYLFFQVGLVFVALFLGEVAFAAEGGLSRFTHVIVVVCCFADVFGTDGDLYARLDQYDKVTHFLGTAAITAGTYDLLRALAVRAGSQRPASDRLFLAASIGLAFGVGWEIYEYLGDAVFHTARAQGRWDTIHDLVSDSLGVIAMGSLLLWQERTGARKGPVAAAWKPGSLP